MIIEGSNRVNHALDEQMHAGSTLYYPVSPTHSMTVSQFFIPTVLVGVSIAFRLLYLQMFNR